MPNIAFATRLSGSRPNPFASMDATVARLRADGVDVIDLSKGNPDGRAPDAVATEGAAAALRDDNFAYAAFSGKPAFLQAAAGWYRRVHGVELSTATQLLGTVGASDALGSLAQAVLDPGDTMVTVEPYYPPYEAIASIAGARLVTLPASAEQGFLPNLTAVDDDLWRRTKLLMLNYPNNPTGATATPAFFRTAVDLARRYGFVVANDFAYAGLGYAGDGSTASLLAAAGYGGDDVRRNDGGTDNDGGTGANDGGTVGGGTDGGTETSDGTGDHRGIGNHAGDDGAGARDGNDVAAVEICSLSKMYTLAGWRAGFIAGDARVIDAVKMYHSQMGSGVSTIVQDAGTVALNSDQSSVRALAARYGRRHALLAEGLERIGLRTFASTGGMFAWVHVPRGWSAEGFAHLVLNEAAVATLPGTAFGKGGEGYVRLSLMKDDAVLRDVVSRIAQTTARW